jgi:DNA-binding NtrC family response regulator
MDRQGNILVVDDNRHILESLSLLLRHDFSKVQVLSSPGELVTKLEAGGFDLVLLDMNFSQGARDGSEGLHWLRQIRQIDEEVLVVLMTAYGDVELAVRGMKEGAADFILKPWNPEKLIANLNTLLKLKSSEKKVRQFQTLIRAEREEAAENPPFFICSSAPMQRIYEAISKLAPTDANVLITGENGTGKEIIARQVHWQSQRKDEVMVSVDLGSLPESLFESELFGHKKGSFTDAKDDRKGRLELASGGTLFLDEVGNTPLPMQVKLLSVLERREVVPIGAIKPVPVDIRLISATNARLQEMIRNNAFREDLYYRINTITLHIPPLRERPGDIEGFCRFFLKGFSMKYRKPGLTLSEKALLKLRSYHWPGNIRELKHAIEKAVIMAENQVLKPSDFIFEVQQNTGQAARLNLQELEKQAIVKAIDIEKGNLSNVAKALGITRATLYAKMKRYRI